MLKLIKFLSLVKKYPSILKNIIDNFYISKIDKNTIYFKCKNNIYYINMDDNDPHEVIYNQSLKLNIYEETEKYILKFVYESLDMEKINNIEIKKYNQNVLIREKEYIKEKRKKGSIIEVNNKVYYKYYKKNNYYLFWLIGNRYAFDKDISIYEPKNELEKQSLLNTHIHIGHNHDYIYINNINISNLYENIKNDDYVMRTYLLCKGIINKENIKDIYDIYKGKINKNAFGCLDSIGVYNKEQEICGKHITTNPYCQDYNFIYNMMRYNFGYKEKIDIIDIKSITQAIVSKNENEKLKLIDNNVDCYYPMNIKSKKILEKNI